MSATHHPRSFSRVQKNVIILVVAILSLFLISKILRFGFDPRRSSADRELLRRDAAELLPVHMFLLNYRLRNASYPKTLYDLPGIPKECLKATDTFTYVGQESSYSLVQIQAGGRLRVSVSLDKPPIIEYKSTREDYNVEIPWREPETL